MVPLKMDTIDLVDIHVLISISFSSIGIHVRGLYSLHQQNKQCLIGSDILTQINKVRYHVTTYCTTKIK